MKDSDDDEASTLLGGETISQVETSNCSMKVQHSRFYLFLNAFCFLVTILMVVLLIIDRGVVRSPWFDILELVVTCALFLDTLILIHAQGTRKFFCGELNADVPNGSVNSFFRKYGWIFTNYGQLLVVLLCSIGFVTTMTAGRTEWEEDVSLAFLFIRFLFILVVLCINQNKYVAAQGGVTKAFDSQTIDDAWDVKF